MSLQAHAVTPVPDETARIARRAFPKGSRWLRLRDELGTIYADRDFTTLFPTRGRPALAPWRLALVTVLQFAEGLSDRQAAEAVRSRIDWKYLLGLGLDDPGFDFSVLCEFRQRLIDGEAEQRLLERLLERCQEPNLLKARGCQRTDSTRVLAVVRNLNRLEVVGETLRHALNVLAVAVPDWLRERAPAAWFDRYGARIEEGRVPQGQAARDAALVSIGTDGIALLTAVYAAGAPAWLREVPAVETLRRVWVQYFHAPTADGTVRLRAPTEMSPAALTVCSPYDTDARFGSKYATSWTGYVVHLTETCDDERPHLITQVATVPATTRDVEVTADIQTTLAARGLLPAEQLADAGYVSAHHLAASRAAHGIDLVGPPLQDVSWQAKAGEGFDILGFAIDWEGRTATCPQGKRSRYWSDSKDVYGNPINQIVFDKRDCLACPCRARCTHSKAGPRTIALRPREDHEALQAAREREQTDEFATRYRKRRGVEGTISQGTRAFELRDARYAGLAKTALQHVATATAINLQRLDDWWTGTPRARTRRSAFAKLAA